MLVLVLLLSPLIFFKYIFFCIFWRTDRFRGLGAWLQLAADRFGWRQVCGGCGSAGPAPNTKRQQGQGQAGNLGGAQEWPQEILTRTVTNSEAG